MLPPLRLALLLGVVVVAVGISVVALRGVITAPSGVAARTMAGRIGAVRFLVLAVLVVVLVLRRSDVSLGVLTALFAAVFGALSLVGPWAVGLLGRLVMAT